MTAAPRHLSPGSKPLIAAVAALVLFAGLLAAVVLASRQSGSTDAPPLAPPFEGFAEQPFERFSVRSVEGTRAVLIADPKPGQSTDTVRELDLPTASIEILRPVKPSDIQVGDSLTVVAVQNEVQNFSIRSIVIQRAGSEITDGVARSPLGFLGYEAGDDLAERPVLGGIVRSIADGTVVLDRGAEPVTLTLTPLAVLYQLDTGAPGDLGSGDRIAMLDGAGNPKLLVLPR